MATTNLLEQAAEIADRDAAVKLVADALGLDPNARVARLHVTWADRWRAFDRESRLVELGGWLMAEAMEARAKTCVLARTPMQTVGTND